MKVKTVCVVLLLAILMSACSGSVPASRFTSNIEKYPFLCEDFQYTIHLDGVPDYVCADSYKWKITGVNKKEVWTYVSTTERVFEKLPGENVVAVTHVGGSVVEF